MLYDTQFHFATYSNFPTTEQLKIYFPRAHYVNPANRQSWQDRKKDCQNRKGWQNRTSCLVMLCVAGGYNYDKSFI